MNQPGPADLILHYDGVCGFCNQSVQSILNVVSWKVGYIHYCPLETHAGCASHVDGNTEYHLSTTAGSSVASDVIWDAPGPGPVQSPVQPVLQLEDGSFVGSSWTRAGDSMVAFDSSGNIRWSVPNYYPGMATADGGVIATSFDWSTYTITTATFDGNGATTGQLPNPPTYSWLGNAYQYGSVEQIVDVPTIGPADTFMPMGSGNPSFNLTAIRAINRSIRNRIAEVAQRQGWVTELAGSRQHVVTKGIGTCGTARMGGESIAQG